MANTTTLQRENTSRLSGGRTASTVTIDGERIRLITSARRKKTISASVREGMIQISAPSTMTDADIIAMSRGLIDKIKDRRAQQNQHSSDEALYERALHLAQLWLGGEVVPTSVVWSDRQTTMWGSCTPTTGAIRLSTMLQGMPQWVIDGVLAHELAHLKYSGHGPDFQDYAARYPKMAQADAFLDGVTFAQQQAGGAGMAHG